MEFPSRIIPGTHYWEYQHLSKEPTEQTLSLPWQWLVISFGAIFAGNIFIGFCIFAKGDRDNSWIDCWRGMQFLIPNIGILVFRKYNLWATPHMEITLTVTPRMWLINWCLWLWAGRMVLYTCYRKVKEEERYRILREKWEDVGECYFFWKGMCNVWVLNACIAFIQMGPVWYVNIFSYGGPIFDRIVKVQGTDTAFYKNQIMNPLDYVGGLIFLFGFIIQLFADRELNRWRWMEDEYKNGKKLWTTGLWKYSRNLNYFGEVVMWWGIYVIAISVKWGWATIYSPVFITWYMYKVMAPMREERYKDEPEWIEYCKTTPMFVPDKLNLCAKKNTKNGHTLVNNDELNDDMI